MKLTLKIGVLGMLWLPQIPAGVGSAEPASEQKDAANQPVEDSISIHMSYLFPPSYEDENQ